MEREAILVADMRIVCAVIFVVTFFIGDVAGLLIEAKWSNQWRRAARRMGFEFDGEKTRVGWLSELFLPTVVFPGTRETPFCYGESLKSLRGIVNGFNILITDFAVWNMHTRGPLVYRMVVCVVGAEQIDLSGSVALVRSSSVLLHGIQLNETLREYDYPYEAEFSRSYVLFGRQGAFPWIVTPELRNHLVEHKRQVDSLFVREHDIVLVWLRKSAASLPRLVDEAVGIMKILVDSVPKPAATHGRA